MVPMKTATFLAHPVRYFGSTYTPFLGSFSNDWEPLKVKDFLFHIAESFHCVGIEKVPDCIRLTGDFGRVEFDAQPTTIDPWHNSAPDLISGFFSISNAGDETVYTHTLVKQ